MLIEEFPKGHDLSIINTYYTKSKKVEVVDNDGYVKEVWKHDFLTIVYRDNIQQRKFHKIIPEPEYTYYISNEDDIKQYPRYFVSKDNVHPITTKYNELEKSIFENLGLKDEYKTLRANKDFRAIKQIHKDPRVFFSDCNIEDYYKFLFSLDYPNNNFKIHKAFFDIEVDGRYQAGDFPELGECPINAISLCDDKLNTVFVFLLRTENNPLIEEFEHSLSPSKFNEMVNFIINAVGGHNKANEFGLLDLKLQFFFFDDEISLLKEFFRKVHEISPDFCLGFNMGNFDMAYIIQRIINLGFEPEQIMCDPKYPKEFRTVYHFIDEKNRNQLNKRSDYTTISGDVVWVDQLLQFAQKRSASYGSFDSFKLDDIGYLVAGVKKLSYAHITNKISELPYLNYYIFVLYNIMDTIVQHCIEWKCKDVEYLYSKSTINNTSYAKCHRQTVYLMNRFVSEYNKKNYIIGNNMNRDNEEPEKYPGAIVLDPKLLGDYSKVKINGVPSMVVDNTIDEDYKSLYPSITNQCNIAPNTQIGQLELPEQVYDKENILKDDKYCRAGEFVENLVCDNIIVFAHRYFKLANIREFIEDFKEYCRMNGIGLIKKHKINPFIRMENKKVNPFIPSNKVKKNPFIWYKPNSEEVKDMQRKLKEKF